ncbi:sugar kinase [Apilactobacillus ozensis DSM 23829 = JCM 17196]|uniref:ADP-dependent (S)-NAD(P)H-hydrate dehydratase n=1 Tax=Apilactobacillus ozensis DSM 23829 = JCM 17196 TaxID=1423781 RepID=A0A0R2AL68_9LACO|nr:NAD(P)H-hydrate dehydratase [Apilactobacillus ozensis]KRM67934.1 sugar kinase [Apilactobacillus ozensis DSM 23829 = JCM 17196]
MINLSDKILEETIIKRPNKSYKGTFGRITLIGGNKNFAGAIIMASSAAVYAGAGLVTTMTDKNNKTALNEALPEAMYADYKKITDNKALIQNADVIVIGPGLGTNESSEKILRNVLKLIGKNQKLIIDGSAITLIAKRKIKLPQAKIILTPHQMEWQRLSGIKIDEQNYTVNKKCQEKLNAIVVLKSHRTEIYTNDKCFKNTVGTPAQATGGMGDTLAGMIAGFIGQFKQTEQAVSAAIYMHSKIAEELSKNQYVVLPHQIINNIPYYMKKYQKK